MTRLTYTVSAALLAMLFGCAAQLGTDEAGRDIQDHKAVGVVASAGEDADVLDVDIEELRSQVAAIAATVHDINVQTHEGPALWIMAVGLVIVALLCPSPLLMLLRKYWHPEN